MKQYIELSDRVLSAEVVPDTPGYCRRTLHVRVESGPGLTEEEYQSLTATLAAELIARGVVVHGWGDGEPEGP